LHHRRGDDPEGYALEKRAGGFLQKLFQDPTRKGPKAILEKEHAEKKNRHTGRDLLEIGAYPEAGG
jgi:hypothetical protein